MSPHLALSPRPNFVVVPLGRAEEEPCGGCAVALRDGTRFARTCLDPRDRRIGAEIAG